MVSPTVAGSLVLYSRLQAKLTQRELADRLGVAQPVIAAYETGRRQPTVPTLMRILRGAGFDLRLGLTPHDDHDDVLAALELRRPTEEQERWRSHQAELVSAARENLENWT
jgi:transcriptional regulator with XRE-family HTH domain